MKYKDCVRHFVVTGFEVLHRQPCVFILLFVVVFDLG